jgi:Nuclease-related domain
VLPGTHSGNGAQATVKPVADADLAWTSGQNTGISGTRHSVAHPQQAPERYGPQPAPVRYADSGVDDVSAGYEKAPPLDDEPDEPDDGIPILQGIVTTEVPDDDDEPPTLDLEPPGPEWNQRITGPPRPVVASPESKPPPFGVNNGVTVDPAAAGNGGQPSRSSVRDLPPDVRLRIWQWRAVIMIVVGVVFSIIVSWPVGLTLAILAGIIDTIYRSRTAGDIAVGGSQALAQRRTRRQLARMRRAGYLTLDARPIPNSREVIDHLVVGPTGVYAIDSERWHRRLPIRTYNGKQLWLGPEDKKPRLAHARWEAQQASDLLSAALGTEIVVRPAMAVYGPKIPWDVAIIRNVDVFSGPELRKYLKRRARTKGVPRLSREQVQQIYEAAGRVLPDVAPTMSAAPVGLSSQ